MGLVLDWALELERQWVLRFPGALSNAAEGTGFLGLVFAAGSELLRSPKRA